VVVEYKKSENGINPKTKRVNARCPFATSGKKKGVEKIGGGKKRSENSYVWGVH